MDQYSQEYWSIFLLAAVFSGHGLLPVVFTLVAKKNLLFLFQRAGARRSGINE